MDTKEIQLRKDLLIAQIKLGLHLTGVRFNKKVTRHLSIEQLEQRIEWLRQHYITTQKRQAA